MDKITKKVLTFSVTAKPEWFTSIFESWTVEVMTDAAEVSSLLKLQGLPGVPSAYRREYREWCTTSRSHSSNWRVVSQSDSMNFGGVVVWSMELL